MTVATMAPVAAQTPDRVPVGTTTTVRTDCVGDNDSSAMGWGGNVLVCRDRAVRIPKTSTNDTGVGALAALSLVAGSGDDVRRISYRTSAPAE